MTIKPAVRISDKKLIVKDRAILPEVPNNVVATSSSDSGPTEGVFVGAMLDEKNSRHVVPLGRHQIVYTVFLPLIETSDPFATITEVTTTVKSHHQTFTCSDDDGSVYFAGKQTKRDETELGLGELDKIGDLDASLPMLALGGLGEIGDASEQPAGV